MTKHVAQTVESAQISRGKSPFYADWTVCATWAFFFSQARRSV